MIGSYHHGYRIGWIDAAINLPPRQLSLDSISKHFLEGYLEGYYQFTREKLGNRCPDICVNTRSNGENKEPVYVSAEADDEDIEVNIFLILHIVTAAVAAFAIGVLFGHSL